MIFMRFRGPQALNDTYKKTQGRGMSWSTGTGAGKPSPPCRLLSPGCYNPPTKSLNSTVYRRLPMHRCILTPLALALALCMPVFSQEHPEHVGPAKAKSATLMTGYGTWHHPVSTKNAQAQAFFDQGLRLIYSFNHDEAARSFHRAAELDPRLAMAYWGIAEAVGPNYNDPASEGRFVQAHAAIEKAQTLVADASESDKAYIAALAMRFPDDLDAATLFAEAGMNL